MHPNAPVRQRGSTMMISLALVFIAAISLTSLMSFVMATHRVNERAIALEKALACAEGGLYRLLHAFDQPGNLPSAAASEAAAITAFFANGQDPAAIQSSGLTFIDEENNVARVSVALGNAHVKRLAVGAPRSGAAAGSVFTFESVAECADSGGRIVERTALMDVAFDQAPRVIVPAGIIAGASVSGNGQFNLNWGEAWAKGPIKLLVNRRNNPAGRFWQYTAGNNQVAGDDDNWVAYRTAEYIRDSAGTILSFDSANPVHAVGDTCQNATNEYVRNGTSILWQLEDQFTPSGQQTLTQKVDAVLNKFGALNTSSTGYEYWKEAAIRRDTYFRIDANGAVYNANGQRLYFDNSGNLTTAGGSAATATSVMEYYRGLDNAYVCFFDTQDGNPPAANGSNWANINFQGSISNQSKGVLYVAGNFSVGGSGTPPLMTVTKPDNTTTNLNVYHDGVVFTYGNYSSQGNAVVYGAVISQGTYNCGGTPNVYYNVRLTTGEPQPLSTRARIMAVVLQ